MFSVQFKKHYLCCPLRCTECQDLWIITTSCNHNPSEEEDLLKFSIQYQRALMALGNVQELDETNQIYLIIEKFVFLT